MGFLFGVNFSEFFSVLTAVVSFSFFVIMDSDPFDPPDPGGGLDADDSSTSSYVSFRSPSSSHLRNDTSVSCKRSICIEDSPPVKKTIAELSQLSNSIQTTFTHADFESIKSSYAFSDSAPFVIHIRRSESDPASRISLCSINFGHF